MTSTVRRNLGFFAKALGAIFVVFLPAVSGNWALFNSKPLVPALAEKIQPYLNMIEFSPYFITVPIGIVMFGVTIREYRRSGGRVTPRDALEIKDGAVQVRLHEAPPEFDFGAEVHPGGIVLLITQKFDPSCAHAGKVMLIDIRRVLSGGIRATVPEFHLDGVSFIKGPLALKRAAGGPHLHFEKVCKWWLIEGPLDKPTIPHVWGTPERREQYPHPFGEFEATVEIEAGGKMSKRTVHYELTSISTRSIGVGP